jgi:hypothetical protein
MSRCPELVSGAEVLDRNYSLDLTLLSPSLDNWPRSAPKKLFRGLPERRLVCRCIWWNGRALAWHNTRSNLKDSREYRFVDFDCGCLSAALTSESRVGRRTPIVGFTMVFLQGSIAESYMEGIALRYGSQMAKEQKPTYLICVSIKIIGKTGSSR